MHSLHAAARVKALRAACGPLQRRTGRARVDLPRLGAPGLRPPLYDGGRPIPSGLSRSPVPPGVVSTGDARAARTTPSGPAQRASVAAPAGCAARRAARRAARAKRACAAAAAILIARAIAGAGFPRPLMDAFARAEQAAKRRPDWAAPPYLDTLVISDTDSSRREIA